LADLEDELDPTSLAESADPEPDTDPLGTAAETLRAGSDTEPVEDAPALDADEQQQADLEAAEGIALEDAVQTADEFLRADTEKAEAEAEEGEPAAEDKEKKELEKDLRELLIPAIARKDGDPRADVALTIDGLPQEHYDMLQGHINRSKQLDETNDALDEARLYQATATFINENPVAGMLMIERQDQESDKPQNVGAEFVELWLSMHPDKAVAIAAKLRLDDEPDPDRLRDKAEAAQLRAEKAVNAGLDKHKRQAKHAQFVTDISGILQSVTVQLRLTGDEAEDFQSAATARINRAAKRLESKGKSPYSLTRPEVLTLIQPAIQRYKTGSSSPTKPKAPVTKPAADTAAVRFKRKDAVAARHRKVAGGRSTAPRATPTGVGKIKGAKGVKEAARRLRNIT
jgi:hypothetical protein